MQQATDLELGGKEREVKKAEGKKFAFLGFGKGI